MDKTLVTVAACHAQYEAELIQGLLETAGIESYLEDQEIIHRDWFYSLALGGVKVRVLSDAYDDAVSLLDAARVEAKQEELTQQGKTCPHCGSDQIERRRQVRKYYFEFVVGTCLGLYFLSAFVNWYSDTLDVSWLALYLSTVVTMVPVLLYFLPFRRWECLDCRYIWKNPGATHPDLHP